jgi:peptidoglycan/xylan/chitin deacetylase (PgdA/CDA1 family)
LRGTLKRVFYDSLGRTGLHALFRPLLGGRGAILLFHRILADPPISAYGPSARLAMPPDAFRAIVAYLRRAGRDIVSLDEALRRLRAPDTGRPFACLTFDDGYRDNYEILAPLCRELEVPVTIYVTTGLIDKRVAMWWYGLERIVEKTDRLEFAESMTVPDLPTRTPREKEDAYEHLDAWLRLAPAEDRERVLAHLQSAYETDFAALSVGQAMTWEMLKALCENEFVEIGAHTVSHPALSALSDDEARSEMEDSRATLQQQLGRPVRHFAYPFGGAAEAGEREFRIARELGFATATTTRPGTLQAGHRDQPHSLPRLAASAVNTLTMLKADLSGAPAAMRAWSQRGTAHPSPVAAD